MDQFDWIDGDRLLLFTFSFILEIIKIGNPNYAMIWMLWFDWRFTIEEVDVIAEADMPIKCIIYSNYLRTEQ